MPFNEILNRVLTPSERLRWESSLVAHRRDVERNRKIAAEGTRPRALYVALEGWLQEYKQLPDGRRQTLRLFLPGQICDLDLFSVARRDSTLQAIGRATIAEIGRADSEALLRTCPGLRQVFCWSEVVSAGIKREWMASLGQRDALERVAHLMCELFVRLHAERRGGEFDFFLTQGQIADATGLTQVHVNRIVQRLRREAGIILGARRLYVPDFDALARIAGFDAGYLHIGEADEAAMLATILFGPERAAEPVSSASASREPDSQRASPPTRADAAIATRL